MKVLNSTSVQWLYRKSVACIGLVVLLGTVGGVLRPTTVRAAAGEGTAQVDIGTGGTNATDATFAGAGASGTITVGTKSYIRVSLTIGASHIAATQNNVTLQAPTNFFPTNGFDTVRESSLSLVNIVGEWAISYTDNGGTNNASIGFTGSSASATGLMTIRANQQMDSGDVLILTFVGTTVQSATAAALDLRTDDTGANDLTAIAAPPTITVVAADASASVELGTNRFVGANGDTTVTLTAPFALDADDTIDLTFPPNISVSGVGSAVTGTFESTDSITCAAAGQVVTCTTSAATNATGTIILTGIKAAFAAPTDMTLVEVENEGSASGDIATDTVVAMTDTLYSDSQQESDTATSFAKTYAIDVTVPSTTDAYVPGQDLEITWNTAGGTGIVRFVSLFYSLDGGETMKHIVLHTRNDGAYTWTVPDIAAANVVVVARATDLLTVLATDQSEAFAIGIHEASEDGDGVVEGSTPETEHENEQTAVLLNDVFVKGESWDTVYYVRNGMRHPFLDSQTYFTHADNFDAVVVVSDQDLSRYALGAPMLPRAGVVLVKIASLNHVFALEAGNTLRWIVSEDVAVSLYGNDWADYVIDVPVTAWGYFNHGDDINDSSDIRVQPEGMKRVRAR